MDLKRHTKKLEEQIQSLVSENIALEAQVKTIPSLKTRLSEYKQRVTSQEVELSEVRAEAKITCKALGR